MNKINNTSFKGDVLRLMTGTGLAQVITLMAAPIITRFYGPEDFGVAATFTAVIGIIGSVACLRYEQTIVLPKSNHEAANLLLLSIIITILITTLNILLITANEYIFGAAKDLIIYPYLWLIPIAVFLSGFSVSMRFWSTRTKHFSRISVAKVSEAAMSTSAKIISGLSGYASGGFIILANIVAQLIFSVILVILVMRSDGRYIYKSANCSTMWYLLKKYKKFPQYGVLAILLGASVWLLPTILFGIYFSPEFAGLYAIGVAVLQIPTSLFGSAIGQVFFQEASEAHKNNTLEAVTKNLFSKLVALCVLPYMMLSVIGGELFQFVFGTEWREGGIYVQYLAPWALLWFLSSPFTVLFSVLEKQELQLKLNIINFSTRIISIIIAIYLDSPILAIILLAVTGAAFYGYKVTITCFVAGMSKNNIITIILKQVVISLPPVLLTLIAMHLGIVSLLILGVAILFLCVHLVLFNMKYKLLGELLK